MPIFRRVLALTDRYLDANSKILDFGCGAGHMVYRFRDAGFDARGFDIHDYLELRSQNDRRFFDIPDNRFGDHSIMMADWDHYRLPYDDEAFDFVLSNQTLEHVLNLEIVVREFARVTKRDGIGIHIFPPRYRFLEGHTYVPFGGIAKSFSYNLFWATLGVRNEFQNNLSAVETAKRNTRYARSGTKYLPIREIQRIGQRHFEIARFRPELWHAAGGDNYGPYGWHMMRATLLAYTMFDTIFWVLERPIIDAASAND